MRGDRHLDAKELMLRARPRYRDSIQAGRDRRVALWPLVVVLVAASLVVGTAPVEAQTSSVRLTGRVVDHETEEMLSGARIELLDNALAVIGHTESEADGRFSLVTSTRGLVALRVAADGYHTQTGLPFELTDDRSISLTARLSASAVLLDPVRIDGRDDTGPTRVETARSDETEIVGTIRGTVLDASGETGLGQVRVELLDEEGATLVESTSNTAGAFLLRTAVPGSFRIRATRIGYEENESEEFTLDEASWARVEIEMSTEAIALDPISVTVESRELLALSAHMAEFFERRSFYEPSGRGRFIEREKIEPFTGTPLTIAVSALAPFTYSVPVQGRGNVLQMRVPGFPNCEPFLFLDGVRVRGVEDLVLDALVPPHLLEGIEVYRGEFNVPQELWDSLRTAPCGAVVLWTRRGN